MSSTTAEFAGSDTDTPPSKKMPIVLFIAIGLLGAFLLAAPDYLKTHFTITLYGFETLIEHLGSAFIVASVMGLTYERLVHRRVMGEFRSLLERHESEARLEREAYTALTAKRVFALIRDIVEHAVKDIPTLYSPTRVGVGEITFSQHQDYFEQLADGAKPRQEMCDELKYWLEWRPNNLPLRFLASDFVGLLRLKALRPTLLTIVDEQLPDWHVMEPDAKSCLLNYQWAASRCEEPMYESLTERLTATDEPFVQSWILFVTRQMADERLALMVHRFLLKKGKSLTKEVLENDVIDAMAALHIKQCGDMEGLLMKFKTLFIANGLYEVAHARILNLPVPRRPVSVFTRAVRRAWQHLPRAFRPRKT
jgi:hypothetical protein